MRQEVHNVHYVNPLHTENSAEQGSATENKLNLFSVHATVYVLKFSFTLRGSLSTNSY